MRVSVSCVAVQPRQPEMTQALPGVPVIENNQKLWLTRPNLPHFVSYQAMIDEMRVLGETIWAELLPMGTETPADFIERLLSIETIPRPERVTETVYWAATTDGIVGRIALRHELNDSLREFGGHIGYEVHPSYRKQGFAKEMLRQVLATPRAQSMGRILVTCSPENIGSRKTILANGGQLAAIKHVERVNRETCYYWIDTQSVLVTPEHSR